MFKKTAIIIAALFTILMSSPASAATDNTSQIPELNPFCWQRKDCHTIRKTFLANPPSCTVGDPSCKELEQGFITAGVDPCTGGTGDDQWGRCLPAGTSKTEISFGGRNKFTNIGDFIIVMYKYLLTIASIVAVVMIIIAGVRWITSGGNSEAISSAKKRIGGAVIGLFIAYMSYFVLNTINPALVNLRLPQVWLVKPIELMPTFCSDIPGAKEGTLEFMYGAGQNQQARQLTPETAVDKATGYSSTMLKDKERFYCGARLFAKNGGNATCFGGNCDVGNMCSNENNEYDCYPGEIVIHLRVDINLSAESIIRSTVWFDKFKSPAWLEDDPGMRVFPVCRGASEARPAGFIFSTDDFGFESLPNHFVNYSSQPKDGPYNRYIFRLGGLTSPEKEKACSDQLPGSVLEGYFFTVEIDENNSFDDPNFNIGYRNGSTVAGHFPQDLTYYDYVPISKLKASGGVVLDAVLSTDKYARFEHNQANTVFDVLTNYSDFNKPSANEAIHEKYDTRMHD